MPIFLTNTILILTNFCLASIFILYSVVVILISSFIHKNAYHFVLFVFISSFFSTLTTFQSILTYVHELFNSTLPMDFYNTQKCPCILFVYSYHLSYFACTICRLYDQNDVFKLLCSWFVCPEMTIKYQLSIFKRQFVFSFSIFLWEKSSPFDVQWKIEIIHKKWLMNLYALFCT